MSVIQRQDHHYVPRFLLKKWCAINDGKMWWYRKVYNGRIVEKRISPKSTYFEPNLNSLKTSLPPFGNVTDDIINLVEEKLMRIDSDSAIILNKMLNDGITSLSQKEKNIWLQFIVLLGERNPVRLSDITLCNDDLLEKTISDCIEKWGREDVWLEAKKNLEEAYFSYNQARVRLYNLINDFDNVIDSDLYEWRICDLTATSIELFITDLPIIYNLDNKISDHIRFIQLAITPKHLFVCALNNFPFDLNMLRDLTILYNAKILLAQPKYVCSRNKIVDEYHFNPSSTKIHFLNKKLSFIF